jgi:hypothetical protein
MTGRWSLASTPSSAKAEFTLYPVTFLSGRSLRKLPYPRSERTSPATVASTKDEVNAYPVHRFVRGAKASKSGKIGPNTPTRHLAAEVVKLVSGELVLADRILGRELPIHWYRLRRTSDNLVCPRVTTCGRAVKVACDENGLLRPCSFVSSTNQDQ